eukprot:scaffold41208_cov283-Skeletonema_dohrnii-CCMP3373.AAC.1
MPDNNILTQSKACSSVGESAKRTHVIALEFPTIGCWLVKCNIILDGTFAVTKPEVIHERST